VETLDNILSRRGEAMPQGEKPETQQQETQAPVEAQQPTQETTETEQAEEQLDGQKSVPSEALHAERQKVKRYTEEVASIREEIARRDQAWEQRINKLLEAQRPQQEPPNIYENPDAAIAHAMQPHMDRVQQVLLANWLPRRPMGKTGLRKLTLLSPKQWRRDRLIQRTFSGFSIHRTSLLPPSSGRHGKTLSRRLATILLPTRSGSRPNF
jgi:hypothetical protein